MSKIGFFGGSFNPITIAHEELILDAMKKYDLEKVFFVPMNDMYDKKELLPINNRKDMIELVVNKEANKDKLDLYLLDNSKKTYAIDSFRSISNDFKDSENFFIMGSDNFDNIKNWKDYEELKKYNFIVLDRKDEESRYNKISSTQVRKNIKENKKIDNLVSKEIEEYIKNNKLYE